MMIGMGIDDSFEVFRAGSEFDSSYSAVEHDVMEKDIADAVKSDSDCRRRKIKNSCQITDKKKRNSNAAEKERKQIVLLESAASRAMVILVQNPKKTMHHVPMHEPGYVLHKTGEKNDDGRVQDDIRDTHGSAILSLGAGSPSPLIICAMNVELC